MLIKSKILPGANKKGCGAVMKVSKILLTALIIVLVFVLPIYDAFFHGKAEVLGVEITKVEVGEDKVYIEGQLTNEIMAVLNYYPEKVGNDLYITIYRVRRSPIHKDNKIKILQYGDFSNLENIYLKNRVSTRQIWNHEKELIRQQGLTITVFDSFKVN